MTRPCIHCNLPLTRYGAKSHLVCHKKHISSRMRVFDRDPTKNKKWLRWAAERAEAERALKKIRREDGRP